MVCVKTSKTSWHVFEQAITTKLVIRIFTLCFSACSYMISVSAAASAAKNGEWVQKKDYLR